MIVVKILRRNYEGLHWESGKSYNICSCFLRISVDVVYEYNCIFQ